MILTLPANKGMTFLNSITYWDSELDITTLNHFDRILAPKTINKLLMGHFQKDEIKTIFSDSWEFDESQNSYLIPARRFAIPYKDDYGIGRLKWELRYKVYNTWIPYKSLLISIKRHIMK